MVQPLDGTISQLHKSWEFKIRCLQTIFIPQDHTAANLAEALEATLESWDLKPVLQVAITTDNGANILKAVKTNLKWEQISCFVHNLNLAITGTIKDAQRLTRALGVCRKVVSSFSTSRKRRRDLKKNQIEKGIPQHTLITVSYYYAQFM